MSGKRQTADHSLSRWMEARRAWTWGRVRPLPRNATNIAKAKSAAREAAEQDRSDPFAYGRRLTHALNGCHELDEVQS